MGEPETLDLELLKRGNNDEICRAIRELELVSWLMALFARSSEARMVVMSGW